jgi:glucose-fructose oxidoreductase
MKLAVAALLSAYTLLAAPLRVAIIGLEHGHVSGFLNGGSALVPAGGALHRPDIEVVGVVEQNRALFDDYARRLRLPASLYFTNIGDMAAKVHPDAALVFTSTFGQWP